MKLTLNWLQDHIDTDLTAETIGAKLTMAGLELDALTRQDQGLEKVVVGFIETIKPHPDADRLTVCQVRINQEILTIVCGAKNHSPGDKVAVARIGARLPNGLEIVESTIRGVISQGMLCSKTELGLATASEGILLIPPAAPEGAAMATILGLDEVILELGITPNRGDCLGVRGIARELGALTATPLRPLPLLTTPCQPDGPIATVHIKDTIGCPRYAGRIINNIKISPSPAWLQTRLEAVGMRAINNVVDVTNFILLDLNQPLHAFDLTHLHLPIVVRRARTNETLRTLDGMERTLTDQMTVIADQQHALALAGIMGGETSGVTETTTDIFLEVAYFDPIATARTGRRLEILSESRHRFERGVDPEALLTVMERATQMILELAGGQAGPITLQDAGTWHLPKPIVYRPQRINQLGGVQLTAETMNALLTGIGCQITPMDQENSAFQVLPPSWRHDLRLEEDLLEEIIRLYGYDNVPTSLPRVTAAPHTPHLLLSLLDRVRTIMVGLGYLEAINYAFVSTAIQHQFNGEQPPLALLNPLSEDQTVLRTDLIAGLIKTAQRNFNRGNFRLRLFEVGRIFLTDEQGNLTEHERLAAILTGPAQERTVYHPLRQTDFSDLSGDLISLFTDIGDLGTVFEHGGPTFLHPGRKAWLINNEGKTIGWMGQLHPAMQESLDLRKEIYAFELNLTALSNRPKIQTTGESTSPFPGIQNDFTFLLPEKTPSQEVVNQILQIDPGLIRQVSVIDIYTGTGVPKGHKNLTLTLLLQANDRTLTDLESKAISEKVIIRMQERFGAALR